MTVLLFTASRDWETVTMLFHERVNRNRINLAARQKVLNNHQMLNYSDILLVDDKGASMLNNLFLVTFINFPAF